MQLNRDSPTPYRFRGCGGPEELNEEVEGWVQLLRSARWVSRERCSRNDADRPTGPPQPLPLLLPRIWRDNEVPSPFLPLPPLPLSSPLPSSPLLRLIRMQAKREDPVRENNRDPDFAESRTYKIIRLIF